MGNKYLKSLTLLSKVIEWIKSEGETSLTKYGALSLECGDTIRDEEQDFEKYYFISMVSALVSISLDYKQRKLKPMTTPCKYSPNSS